MEGLAAAAIAVLIGLIGLLWGADRFVIGAAGAARSLGVSPLVIGLTVVSIGTSAPEIIVSVDAALVGSGAIAVGNALGSNLANIGLVLGVTALIAPLPAQRHLVFQEGPVLLIVTLLLGWCLYDLHLDRGESLWVLAIIPILLWATVRYKSHHPDPEGLEAADDIVTTSRAAAAGWFILGLVVMLLSSRALVWGAQICAREFGVSELIIGLTVVAIGTSLPELAASVASALRGHHDIAIGNVFGSNLFNFLAVMPISGAIAPLTLEAPVFFRDYSAVCILTLLLLGVIAWRHLRGSKKLVYLSRGFGLLLLGLYAVYFVVLAMDGSLTV